jgi:alpha-tubulin suppressor-like RCC1 family protein
VQQKYSPLLVESLIGKEPKDVKCGDLHALVVTRNGDVYAWGGNDYG